MENLKKSIEECLRKTPNEMPLNNNKILKSELSKKISITEMIKDIIKEKKHLNHYYTRD